MSPPPTISIVTPSYNQGAFLEQTIRSVLDQQYPQLEYIVIDGGSTDQSVAILQRYAHELTYWISEPDRGQAHAINKGFAHATGAVFGWLNSDDCLEPGALWAVAAAAQDAPTAGAFVGAGRMVDQAGTVTYTRSPDPAKLTFDGFCQWLDGGDFMQPSCFFRRSAWALAGPLDEQLHIALDLDLWLRMAQQHVPFHPMDTLLSSALAHPQAKTTAYRDHMLIEACIVICKAGGEAYVRQHLETFVHRCTATATHSTTLFSHPLLTRLEPLLRWWLTPKGRRQPTHPHWSAP